MTSSTSAALPKPLALLPLVPCLVALKMNSLKIFTAWILFAVFVVIVSRCGSSDSTRGTGQYFLLVRYNPDGSLDSQFDEDGIVYTFFPYKSESCGKNVYIIGGHPYSPINDAVAKVTKTPKSGKLTEIKIIYTESGDAEISYSGQSDEHS